MWEWQGVPRTTTSGSARLSRTEVSIHASMPASLPSTVSMRITARAAFVLAFVLPPVCGCGARTDLDVVETVADAGDSVADAAVPDAGLLTCPERLAAAPAGSVVWSYPFATPAAGPLAADSSGTTYFLAVDAVSTSAQMTYTVLALDACGALRWQSQPVQVATTGEMRPTVMVSGEQLLVQAINVDAFDLATGGHRWTADLAAFGTANGMGNVLTAEGGGVGPATATNDGVLLVPLYTTSSKYVMQVSRMGEPSVFSRAVERMPGDVLSLIVDAAGQVDLLLNDSVSGALVVAFDRSADRAGVVQFMASLACTQSFIGELASGRSFVAQQNGLCGLGFDGVVRFDTHAQTEGALLIDSRDYLYFSTNMAFSSEGLSGHPRWTRALSSPSTLAALGARNVYVELVASSDPFLLGVTALARDTGAPDWSTTLTGYSLRPTLPSNPFLADDMLLVAPGVLVVGGASMAIGIASGADVTAAIDPWPMRRGGADGRAAVAVE